MSYTLRGRVETRLAASVAPLAVACFWAAAGARAWPLEIGALMVGIGLVLDVLVWDRLEYQPGWAAVPVGLVELAAVMAAATALDVDAPLQTAVLFFVAAWVVAQLVGHAVLPLVRLSYAEDGGELGRGGALLAVVLVVVVGGGATVARASRPPTVLLRGVHGPLVVTRAETLVGDGAIVRGGIVIRADEVTVRGVTIVGGENGIDVEDARRVRLEHVRITGASLDGIHVRKASVSIRDCTVETSSPSGQGIDISFAMSAGMSDVSGCQIGGGGEGIATHVATVDVRHNTITGTRGSAISLGEMSMGSVTENSVRGATGVGILCSDSSHCEIARNEVAPVRPDRTSGDLTRMGYGIEAHYNAFAELRDNRAGRVRAFLGSEIRRG